MDHLTGREWLRAPEEEAGPVRVYHPRGHPLPPARGREGLRFHDDGRFEYLVPGRDDRPAAETGTWRVEPGGGGTVHADVAGQAIVLRIAAVSEDVLRLEWLSR